MKLTQLLLGVAAAGALAFAPGQAAAATASTNHISPFTVSATVKLLGTNFHTGNSNVAVIDIQTIVTKSLSTKDVFLLISNAVASTNNTTGHRTNFPAGSFLVFDPSRLNADDWQGVFYVTNNNGFYYQLDGFSTNSNYYSYIELDSYALGYDYNLNEVASYTYNTKTGNGPETDFDTAILYIHDDPASYDIAEYPSEYYSNNYAIVITGILRIDFNDTAKGSIFSGTLSGAGNGKWKGSEVVVMQGKAGFQGKGPH